MNGTPSDLDMDVEEYLNHPPLVTWLTQVSETRNITLEETKKWWLLGQMDIMYEDLRKPRRGFTEEMKIATRRHLKRREAYARDKGWLVD